MTATSVVRIFRNRSAASIRLGHGSSAFHLPAIRARVTGCTLFIPAGIRGPEIGIKNLKIIFKFLRLNTGLHRLNIARTSRIKVFPDRV